MQETFHATAGTSFGRWLKTEFAWSERTAQDWMRATKFYHNLDHKIRSKCGGLSRTTLIHLADFASDGDPKWKPGIGKVLEIAGQRSIGATEALDVLVEELVKFEFPDEPAVDPDEPADDGPVDLDRAYELHAAEERRIMAEHAPLTKEQEEEEERQREWDNTYTEPPTLLCEAIRRICDEGEDASLRTLDADAVAKAEFILGKLRPAAPQGGR